MNLLEYFFDVTAFDSAHSNNLNP